MKYIVTFFTIVILLSLGFIFWYYGTHLPGPKQSTTTTQNTCQALTVLTPKPGDNATSPLSITVIVDNTKPGCHWTVFEAQAGTAELRDSEGNFLGQAVLKTTDDWTLAKPTPYNAVITFTQHPQSGNLTLIIHEENPSGNSHPKEVTVTLSQ